MKKILFTTLLCLSYQMVSYQQVTLRTGSGPDINHYTKKEARRIAEIIRWKESRNRYDLLGASGEYGAYQWMPSTWVAHSLRVYGRVVKPTKEHQDHIAYEMILSYLFEGYSPEQIASLWNSGKTEWQGRKGYNSRGVWYDTETYVLDFLNLYKNNNYEANS